MIIGTVQMKIYSLGNKQTKHTATHSRKAKTEAEASYNGVYNPRTKL